MLAVLSANVQLITAPTNDRILDGITRKSIIALAEDDGVTVEVRRVAVKEIVEAANNGELKEIFGAGTAATIVPFLGFDFNEKYYELPEVENSYGARFKQKLQDIQYNQAEDKFGWRHEVK